MGLAINSNFSKVSYGASAAMKSHQGVMGKALTKISTNKRFAGGGNSTSIGDSYKSKAMAAGYEALYYKAQGAVADANVQISQGESALEALSAYVSKSIASDTTGADDMKTVYAAIASSVTNLTAGSGISIGLKANYSSAGNLTAGSVSVPNSSAIINASTAATNIGTLGTSIANAYSKIEAADYASTFLQNMAGAYEAAHSAYTDTDIALEMTKYVAANINSQAAQAMVSQANQSMASILNLLQ